MKINRSYRVTRRLGSPRAAHKLALICVLTLTLSLIIGSPSLTERLGHPALATPSVVPSASPSPTPSAEARSDFWFGSYGRVGLSSDLQGGEGQPRQVTSYASRLIEDHYLELDFGYHAYRGALGEVDTVLTLALFDRFFHYSGQADAQLAIRRAFVEARRLWGTSLWLSIGSRWLRGNDIYLMNFWPLDDLNSMGITLGHRGTSVDAFLHVGVNRLSRREQEQYIAVPSASGFGAEEILLLNRQRLITALLYEQRVSIGRRGGWKWKLYGELHALPQGTRALEGGFSDRETLPDDLGLIAGLQLGLWGLAHQENHLNLWLRYARGLTIYDELGVPQGLDLNRRSWAAEELRIALAGHVRWRQLSAQFGGYLRRYLDADRVRVDFDDRVEGSIVFRPQLNFGIFTPAVEGSVQMSQAMGANPLDLTRETAKIYQFALIPALSFGEEIGTFTRPQLRLIYAISWLNDAALARFAPEDPRASQDVTHHLGARAEWWFGRGGGY
jgi:hypothetical protein